MAPYIFALLTLLSSGAAANEGFLVQRGVKAGDVLATLQTFLQGSSGAAMRRQSKISASMRASFEALPKSDGLLSPKALRHLVQGYFAHEHGWLIEGLGSHSHQDKAPEVHAADVLEGRAPEILETLLAAQKYQHGFSFSDAVAMAATLERLIVDESIVMLETAYSLNEVATSELVNEHGLREVLLSLMLLFELGDSPGVADFETHTLLKEDLEASIGSQEDDFWERLDEFQSDIVQNYLFADRHLRNPFSPRLFSFEEALELVETIFHSYGQWQHSECRLMKTQLMDLDRSGFGRVPLSSFYSQPETAIFKFGESVEYLQQTGALEDLGGGHEPHVLIANYLAGPSNCIAGSAYYSICCLNECTGLMSELEGSVRAPTATVGHVLDLVSNMSSSSVDAPRQLPFSLVKKLQDIAENHGGEVPLHGRLFAQWMHYAFPLECQFPQNVQTIEAMSPSHWQEKGHSATSEEKDRYIARGLDNSYMPVEEAEDLHMQRRWHDEEFLPFHDGVQTGLNIASVARHTAHVLLIAAGLRACLAAWRTLSEVRSEAAASAKSHAHFV